MPDRLTSPTVGLMPTRPVTEDGHTIEPSVSVPTPTRREVGGDGGARARARSAGITIESVGVLRLAAAPAPTARRLRRAKLAHSLRFVFPRMHRAGRAQALDHECVLGRDRALECQRARGRHHAVRSVDVVLDEDRDAVERPARAPGLAFGVERVGDRPCLGIDLEHRAERRTGAVDLLDPPEVEIDDLPRRIPPRLHPLLQLFDGHLIEHERGGGACAMAATAEDRPGGRPRTTRTALLLQEQRRPDRAAVRRARH